MRIASQCILVLLDNGGSSIQDWLEEEFGDYPTYKMSPDSWVSRFIRDATNGRAEFTFDPDRNQAQIMVGAGCDEELIAYQDISGPVGDPSQLATQNKSRPPPACQRGREKCVWRSPVLHQIFRSVFAPFAIARSAKDRRSISIIRY